MRLSDFKDEKAIEVIADLIDPISVIAQEVKKVRASKSGSQLTVAQVVGISLKKCKKEAIQMFAILNDIPPEEYHCTGATIMSDMIQMFSDPQLMQLFGLRSEMQTSSGSVSENIEVAKQ